MANFKFKIYKLIKDDKVIYVGRTTNKYLSNRMTVHRDDGNEFDSYELIELTDDPTREGYWIKHYDTFSNGLNKNESGLAGGTYNKTSYKKRPIEVFNNTGFKEVYVSIAEASRQLNLNQSNLTYICQGKRKTHKGFKAKYIEGGK